MQVIANFVSNAIKFTTQGRITLAAKEVGSGNLYHRIRFTVQDTGIGIREEEVGLIFDRFTQLDDSLARGQRGTGLGLAICRKLSEAMDGELGFNSTPNAGSSFWLEVPLEASPSPSPDGATGGQAPALPPPGPCRVLLVEDDAINRLAARVLLEGAGHRVVLAENGREALERLRTENVDIVLMDIHMPVMDGLAATREIRGHGDARVRSLPIVALTASILEDECMGYLEAGVDGVAAKPLDMKHLNQLVGKLVVRQS